MTVYKVLPLPILIVITSVITLLSTCKVINLESKIVTNGSFKEGVTVTTHAAEHWGPVSEAYNTYQAKQLNPLDNSQILHSSFRYKNNEFSKLDESYQYQASKSFLADYQSCALRVKEQYPDIPQRLDVYRSAIEKAPNHRQLLADYVTLLGWDKQYQASLEFWGKHLRGAELPVYVLNTLGLSAREIGNYELSRSFYVASLKQIPRHTQALLGLSVLDVRQKRYSVGEARILGVLSEHPGNEEALNLLAYLYNQQGKPELDRIAVYEKLQEKAVGTTNELKLRRLRTLSLLNIGAVEIAASQMEQNPQVYNEDDWLKLRSVQNTYSIRRVTGSARGLEAQANIEQAFHHNQLYIDLIEERQPVPLKQLAVAYADRIVLLNKLSRHEEATTVLANEKSYLFNELPAYGLIALADSYQGVAQPRKSLSIIQTGFEHQKIEANNRDALKVGYYAALETGKIDQAELYLERLTEGLTPWRYSQDRQRRKFNPNYGNAALMRAMHKSITNDLPGAEKDLRELLELAPQNNEYRQNLADVLRWRGFVVESDHQLSLIHATDPDYEPSYISEVYNRLAHREFEQSRNSIDELKKGRQTNRFKLLSKDYAIAVDPSLELSVSGGNSSGSNFSSQDRNYGLRVNSRLYNDHWRMFATLQKYRSSFFQENESTATEGIGVSYLSHDFSAEVELFDAGNFEGVEVGGRYRRFVNDHVTLDFSYYSFNKNTPVRAVYSGVDSDLSSVSFNYYHDERQQYSVSMSQSNFSDGNKRDSFSLSGSQVLFYDYNQRLTLFESLYIERNSLDADRFYYNPDSSLGGSLGIAYEEMLYKHASTSLWHGVRVEYGAYNQKGFDIGDVGSISYFHQWQFSRRSNLSYSIGYNRRLYDGLKETGPVFNLSYGVTF